MLVTHKEGEKLGLEFMFNIGDSTNDFTQALRWNVDTSGGDAAPWQSTEFFGELTLGAPIPEPIVEEIAAPVESVPEAETVPEVVASKAAQTNDNIITVTAVLIIFGALTMAILKKKVVK